MEVLVFGGTSEGRELVEWLAARGSCDIVACTATEYGASLLPEGPRVTCLRGPLSAREKRQLVAAHDFCCVVDATHPYALHISDSIAELAAEVSLEVVRIVREGADDGDGPWVSVRDATEAAHHLAGTTGNVLLTTGSKDLDAFVAGVPDARERLYVRVLPLASVLERTERLGIPAAHVIAMQGPFSARLNEALIAELDIGHLVTKQSGAAGGFAEKAEAAAACGISLVVIERPRREEGVSLRAAQQLLEERHGL